MTGIKERLSTLLIRQECKGDIVWDRLLPCHRDEWLKKADEIINLFAHIAHSIIKEKLYRKALERELKDKYEEDQYEIHCRSCGDYNPIAMKIVHYHRCPTAQLERILAI